MRFVHSLVKTQVGEKKGWCAPIELGEDAPHYVSFVVPIGDKLDDRYTCELVRAREVQREIISLELIRVGKDSFFLTFDGMEVWFIVRPVSRQDRGLSYIGKLKHSDFAFPFMEIEPESPAVLDQLFLERGVGVLGCDPFRHYGGLVKMPA
jgi:hypothetical protein